MLTKNRRELADAFPDRSLCAGFRANVDSQWMDFAACSQSPAGGDQPVAVDSLMDERLEKCL